jgi:hypothetical protein
MAKLIVQPVSIQQGSSSWQDSRKSGEGKVWLQTGTASFKGYGRGNNSSQIFPMQC